MAFTAFITLDELNHFNAGELQALLASAYAELGATAHHSVERLRVLVTIQNIETMLATLASGTHLYCVPEPEPNVLTA